jgi:hypothetical protein
MGAGFGGAIMGVAGAAIGIVEPGAIGIAELGADIGLMLFLSCSALSMSAE